MVNYGEHFVQLLRANESKSPATAAIETMYEVVKTTQATTLTGLNAELHKALRDMMSADYSCVSVRSAGELFMRFISLAALDQRSFEQCKSLLLDRGTESTKSVAWRRSLLSVLRDFV